MPNTYGPNHAAVESFIEELSHIAWFTALGESTPDDDSLVRVGLNDVLRIYPDSYHLWGDLLIERESPIDRLIFDSGRLGADDALQAHVHISGDAVDKFLVGLARDYPDYYEDTYGYVYERVHLPERLVRYAAREALIGDLVPELHFFTELMVWFRRGHWPLGWQGIWPAGKLLLW